MRTRITSRIRRELSENGLVVTYWEDYDYTQLNKVPVRTKKGRQPTTYSEAVIMADTETSKKEDEEGRNHVCAWSIAIGSLGIDVAGLWGKKPSDMMKCIRLIKENLRADEVFIYFHNLSYDWCFLRKFFFSTLGFPESQLNTKPLYPIIIRFQNGLTLRDSLCLAQRSLEKWSEDMDVTHKKAVGKWDYDLIRNFDSWNPNEDEKLYIMNDVLAGIECLMKTMQALKKTVRTLPVTATGIPRGIAREIGRKNRAHQTAVKLLPNTYADQFIFELAFHGGYTHPNRFCKNDIYPNYLKTDHWLPVCMDYASSYPYQVLTKKMPDQKFFKLDDNVDAEYIKSSCDEYAFLIHIKCFGASLKNGRWPMPVLQDAKCLTSVNNICDNGRILKSDYFDMWVTDPDFLLIDEQYKFDKLEIDEVWTAHKDYLPRWFRDYIYELFGDKTRLKGVDVVRYSLQKAALNAASFGMCAQKPVKLDIDENYETGEYSASEDFDFEEAYQKHLKNFQTFLPYSWGVWITAYAQYDLFLLGKCVPEGDIWLYSDTDSVYATGFDEEKLNALNESRKKVLTEQGYPPILWNDREYYPGVAEYDGTSMQFKAIHSKCYCKRPLTAYGDGFIMGGDLKITVAGVPKRGAKSLHNNINNFKPGFLFDGKTSGKLQHTYYYVDEIYTDAHGNETGDSIDLTECDYIINDPNAVDFNALLEEEVYIREYEDID